MNNLYLFNMRYDSFLQKNTYTNLYFWNRAFIPDNRYYINVSISIQGFYYLTNNEKYQNYYYKENENILNAVYSYCFHRQENHNQILIVPHKNYLSMDLDFPDFIKAFKL